MCLQIKAEQLRGLWRAERENKASSTGHDEADTWSQQTLGQRVQWRRKHGGKEHWKQLSRCVYLWGRFFFIRAGLSVFSLSVQHLIKICLCVFLRTRKLNLYPNLQCSLTTHTFAQLHKAAQIHTLNHTVTKMSRISPPVRAAVVHTLNTLLAARCVQSRSSSDKFSCFKVVEMSDY